MYNLGFLCFTLHCEHSVRDIGIHLGTGLLGPNFVLIIGETGSIKGKAWPKCEVTELLCNLGLLNQNEKPTMNHPLTFGNIIIHCQLETLSPTYHTDYVPFIVIEFLPSIKRLRSFTWGQWQVEANFKATSVAQ